MCSGDAFPGHNAAKCWGFTSLAFSVLCLLGGVNVFIANGNTGVVIGALGQCAGGLVMIRATRAVGSGRGGMTLPSQGATSLELDGAQGQANASRAVGIIAVVFYFISVIGWILSLPLTMQCANVEGCVRGSELSRVPGAIGDLVSRGDIPAQCSISDCMELERLTASPQRRGRTVPTTPSTSRPPRRMRTARIATLSCAACRAARHRQRISSRSRSTRARTRTSRRTPAASAFSRSSARRFSPWYTALSASWSSS